MSHFKENIGLQGKMSNAAKTCMDLPSGAAKLYLIPSESLIDADRERVVEALWKIHWTNKVAL